MKIASTIARYLLGFIFLTFGLNGFLHFIPMPPPTGVAAQFFGALFVSRFLRGDFSVANHSCGPVACESLRASGTDDSWRRDCQHTLLSYFHGACGFAAGCRRYGFVVSCDLECAFGVLGDPSTLSKS
jgi:hypothetical protein